MTNQQIRTALLEALAEVAPDADLARLGDDDEFREKLDIDSMDHLNFVIAVSLKTGIDVPEKDYGKMRTLRGAVEYLERKAGAG